MTDNSYRLYGMTASLYTAKVRAYLNYHRIDYVEVSAGSKEYNEQVVPEIGRWIVPALKTPAGEYIQDGTAILDYLQQHEPHRGSIYVDQPVLGSIAHILELFGSEGLLRPAMHYRWNFNDENLAFLKSSFYDVTGYTDDAKANHKTFLFASGRMRKASMAFGVTPKSQAKVEQSFQQFLALLETHFTKHPFLLGGRRTIADYSFYGPLYAHLSRDPEPLALIQKTAPHVFRWVERMNSPADYIDHVFTGDTSLFSDDAIPESLMAILRYVSEEYLSEISAHTTFANEWLAERPELESLTSGLDKIQSRSIGFTSFSWRGIEISSAVMLYRFYLLKRLTDFYEQLDSQQQAGTDAVLTNVGLEDMVRLKTTRPVVRHNQFEVWQ